MVNYSQQIQREMEVDMATRRNSKVEAGVHFLWRPRRRKSNFPACWINISHRWSVVCVFEPRREHGHKPKYWTVVLYKPGIFPISNDIAYQLENFHGTKKSVWKKAAKLAKRKLE